VPTDIGPSQLTNTSLAIVALLTTAGAIWVWQRRSSAALAPLLLAVPILLIALFGGPLWEWSKYSRGAGLGPEIRAVPFVDSVGATALLWACIGAGLSAFLLPRVGRGPGSAGEATAESFHSRTVSIVCTLGTLQALIVWIIGSGPSLLARDVYLQTDGITFFLRVGWPFAFLGAIVVLVLTGFERDPLLKSFMWVTAALVYVMMTAVGTRMAIAFPFVAALVLIAGNVRNRRLNVISLAAAVALLGLAAITFSVVYIARAAPHGLLNLPSLIQAVIDRSDGLTDFFMTPVKQLGASIVVAYPLTEQSARFDLLDILVANANPLPGTSLGRNFEIYWPFNWVPLSFAGTWYGATGWVGQVLVFCFMGWTTGYAVSNFQRSRLPYASLLPITAALALAALSIEYSSRQVWRVLSIAVVMLVVSYVIRKKRAGNSLLTGEYVHPQSDRPDTALGGRESVVPQQPAHSGGVIS
jgi:hypothetical protein